MTCPVTQEQQSSVVPQSGQCCLSVDSLNALTALKIMQSGSCSSGVMNVVKWEHFARVNGMCMLAKASVCLSALYVQIRVTQACY